MCVAQKRHYLNSVPNDNDKHYDEQNYLPVLRELYLVQRYLKTTTTTTTTDPSL